MTNRVRGEISVEIEGTRYTLCLTLGALAEIEAALGLSEIAALGPRFEKMGFADLLAVLGALLRGGGEEVSDEDVYRMQIDVNQAGEWIARAFQAAGWSSEGNARAPQGSVDRPPGGAISKSVSA